MASGLCAGLFFCDNKTDLAGSGRGKSEETEKIFNITLLMHVLLLKDVRYRSQGADNRSINSEQRSGTHFYVVHAHYVSTVVHVLLQILILHKRRTAQRNKIQRK